MCCAVHYNDRYNRTLDVSSLLAEYAFVDYFDELIIKHAINNNRMIHNEYLSPEHDQMFGHLSCYCDQMNIMHEIMKLDFLVRS